MISPLDPGLNVRLCSPTWRPSHMDAMHKILPKYFFPYILTYREPRSKSEGLLLHINLQRHTCLCHQTSTLATHAITIMGLCYLEEGTWCNCTTSECDNVEHFLGLEINDTHASLKVVSFSLCMMYLLKQTKVSIRQSGVHSSTLPRRPPNPRARRPIGLNQEKYHSRQ